jgi:hypothetical protein
MGKSQLFATTPTLLSAYALSSPSIFDRVHNHPLFYVSCLTEKILLLYLVNTYQLGLNSFIMRAAVKKLNPKTTIVGPWGASKTNAIQVIAGNVDQLVKPN